MRVLSLGEGFGLEFEYMVVDKESLDVRPIVDKLIALEVGEIVNEVEDRDIGWSNELALHIVELKNLDPLLPFPRLLTGVKAEITQINHHLENHFQCQLLPSAMHPWMIPEKDSHLWPYGNQHIYQAYNRIFGCSGHGWTNLQSVHLNFSFSGGEEFRRLHRAIRLILPLIPVLAASSPYCEGRRGTDLDMRLHVYLNNQKRIPEISGPLIPEDVDSIEEYEKRILQPMYQAIAPFDPQGILQHEWLNSRAAIPKFKYGCLEIRLMDIQECPEQDIAIAWFFRSLVECLLAQSWTSEEEQALMGSLELKNILTQSVREASGAIFHEDEWLKNFGVKTKSISGRELVQELLGKLAPSSGQSVKTSVKNKNPIGEMDYSRAIQTIIKEGSLAERIVKSTGLNPSRSALKGVYQELANCLKRGKSFHA